MNRIDILESENKSLRNFVESLKYKKQNCDTISVLLNDKDKLIQNVSSLESEK